MDQIDAARCFWKFIEANIFCRNSIIRLNSGGCGLDIQYLSSRGRKESPEFSINENSSGDLDTRTRLGRLSIILNYKGGLNPTSIAAATPSNSTLNPWVDKVSEGLAIGIIHTL